MGLRPVLTAQELADASGATVRQIRWWKERGVLTPVNGSYTRRQVATAQRLALLSKCGIHAVQNSNLVKLKWAKAIVLREPRVIGDVLVVPAAKTGRR